MKRLIASALATALAVCSAGVGAMGQPPATSFDFADDLARIRGDKPDTGDLLGDLSGADRGSAADADRLDPASLADEFDASIGKIRSQEALLAAQDEARRARAAEEAHLAAIRADEDRRAQLAASHAQSLNNACDRNYDRCESRCSGASNGAMLGAFADALAGKSSSAPLPSYGACASQCRNDRTQCQSAADAGQSRRPSFTGPSASNGGRTVNPSYGGSTGQSMSQGASGTDTPQCRAAEAEARQAMSGLGRSQGICQAARESLKMYQAGLRYLQSCPAADPTGGQRRQHEAAIAQSRDVERNSCN